MNITYILNVIYNRNKINHHMVNCHLVRWWKDPNPISPSDKMRWSATHTGYPASIRCMKSLWDNLFIVLFTRLVQNISSTSNKLFPTQFLKLFYLTGSTLCCTKSNVFLIPLCIWSKLIVYILLTSLHVSIFQIFWIYNIYPILLTLLKKKKI